MNKKLLLTTEKLVDLSEKWTVKLEFSVNNLIQIKKVLHSKNISLKEFISFLSYMIEHNDYYNKLFIMITDEIGRLKNSNELEIVKSLSKEKKNIYSILESSNAFKNRKVQDNTNIKDENENITNKNSTKTVEDGETNKEYEKYLNIINKFQGIEEDIK